MGRDLLKMNFPVFGFMYFSSACMFTTSAMNISCDPSSIISLTLHSMLKGDSSIVGADIFRDFPGVRFISLNLS